MRSQRFRAARLLPLVLLLPGLGASGCNAVRPGLPALLVAAPASELTLTVGPFDLAPGADHADTPQPAPLHTIFPIDGWVHGFAIELESASGDTVPAEVLHHLKVLLPGRRELFHPIALRLVGAGSETRSAELPLVVRVPLDRGDSLVLTAMVHNPTPVRLEDVKIHVRVRFTAGPRWPTPVAIQPFFAHVTSPLEESHYDLPPGRSEVSREVRPAVGGRILALGGHIHRYGTSLRLEDVTAGRELWRSRIRADAAGHVVEIPRTTYYWTKGLRLRPDHFYRITATYDNPTGDVIRGSGMGTVGGIFESVGPWPPVARDDPLYVADLARELEGLPAHHASPESRRHQQHR